MANDVDKRFDLGMQAAEHLGKALKALYDAGLYTNSAQKAAIDLAHIVTSGLYILDPERAAAEADKAIAESEQTIKDAPDFVGEDRPGTGMYL